MQVSKTVSDMNYYLLFGYFEDDEGAFFESETHIMNFFYPQHKLTINKVEFKVNESYLERGMSDFLKVGFSYLVSNKVKKVFFENGFSGVQFVPVNVNNNTVISSYSFFNPLVHYDILDTVASKAEDFNPSIGGYTRVFEELIDIARLERSNISHDCFTLSNFKRVIYVNEKVKNALEDVGVQGIEFIPMEFSSRL